MKVYLARQPIFDHKQNLVAYELLYRMSEINHNMENNGNIATMELISNTLLSIGLDKVSRGKRLFINFPKELLSDQVASILPKEQVAIEISEDTLLDCQKRDVCKQLYKEGFTLVLNNFSLNSMNMLNLDVIEIVKIDFQTTDAITRARIEALLKKGRIKLLAKKIETLVDFEVAKAAGYDYFQGFFFCESTIITGKSVPNAKLQSIRLVQAINKPDLDVDQIEYIIKQDPALSFKLLRFINSPVFPLRIKVSSIRQAITLLGRKELFKWVSMVALYNAGYDKPDELIVLAVTRAKFCESVALVTKLKDKSSDLYLTGLFSLLDTFLDQPMEDILSALPLAEEIKEALLGKEGDYKSILDLILLYERGKWNDAFELAASRFDLDEMFAVACYLESMEQADVSWA